MLQRSLLVAVSCLAVCRFGVAGPHRVIVQGNNRLAIVAENGSIEWEMPWRAIHDIHVLANGNIMVQQGAAMVVEIERDTKQIVWSYDAGKMNGNAGKKVEVHAFQPLPNDRVMIAESGPGRIIEIDRAGNLMSDMRLTIDGPHPHHDTRLARKLRNGNYLVCHENDGVVREYESGSGNVVWEYRVPLFDKPRRPGHGPESFGNQVFSAVRLPNGNTLIGTGNGHGVLEVSAEKEIVWKLEQHELPGITLAWVTTLEVLPTGHYVIGNCHAGPKNPLLIEIDPKTKKLIWTFDHFETFGNSVSNSQLLNLAGKTLR